MAVKITKRLKVLKITEQVKPKFFRILDKFIKNEIISAIESGRSPVSNKGADPQNTGGGLRFNQYSDSYKKSMGKGKLSNKKQRPVNLTLTGKMLKSIRSRSGRNSLRVWFTSPIAKYHNNLGAGKKKVIRRMLPKAGEEFNSGIKKRIANALKNAIKLIK